MARKWSELVARMSLERRARSAALTKEIMREMPLTMMRCHVGMPQAQLADLLGIYHTRLARIERRSDIYLSTLRRYVEAMGGELEITARFTDGEIRLHDWEPEPLQVPTVQ